MNNLSRISSAPYIALNNSEAGIVGLMINDPVHGKILSELAEYLLKGEHELSISFRELIATYVSKLNNCNFCYNSHKEIALASSSEADQKVILEVLGDEYTSLDKKYQALLALAGLLTHMPQGIPPQLVEAAKADGATDAEILRTVQIASAFCMYNRYVDGLGTVPGTCETYKEAGKNIAANGYMIPLTQEQVA